MKNRALVSFHDFRIYSTGGKEPLVDLPEWQVAEGEIHVVTGESGAGKSLTAFSIARLLNKSLKVEGNIFFYSEKKGKLETNSCSQNNLLYLRRKELGFVVQQPLSAFNPVKKIGIQLTERAQWVFSGKKEQVEQCIALLKKLDFEDPERIMNSFPHQLSGGQLQRTAIAMATLVKPRLLIADEPTSALDAGTRSKIIEQLVFHSRESGSTLLLVTHDLDMARKIADRISVFKGGRLEETIINHQRAQFSQSYPIELFKKHRLFYHSPEWYVGYPPEKTNGDHAIPLSLSNVSVTFHQVGIFSKKQPIKALDNINYTFSTINTGILGKTGSGKSTLGKVICGLLEPGSGYVECFRKKYMEGIRDKAYPNIQMVFQDPHSSFNPVRRMEVQVLEASRNRKERVDLLSELLRDSGLERELLNRYPSQLSGGQLQRLAIIRVLLSQPNGIVFDEFVTALDIHWKIEVLKMVKKLVFDSGIPHWVISHEEVVLKKLCGELIELEKGRIVNQS